MILATLRTLLIAALLISTAACSSGSKEEKFKALLEKAEGFKKEEKFEEARITLQSAIDLNPESAQAYYELAEVLVRLKRFGNALENYRSALNIDPKHWNARLHLASFLLAAQQFEFAEAEVVKLLEQDPNNTEAKVLRANLFAVRRNFEDAKKIINEVLAQDANSIVALATLADIELAEGRADKAEEIFLKAIKIDEKNDPLRLALADLYGRQGRLDEAQTLLEGLVKSRPDDARLRYFFGEFLVSRGFGARAVDEYEKTLKSNPSEHNARDRLYDVYIIQGNVDAAYKLTKDIQEELGDQDPAVLYFQARDLELQGKPDEALKLYLKAITTINNFAPLFRRAGLIEYDSGETAAGIQHLQQAVAIDPFDVGARLTLARDLFSKRDMGPAKEHVEKVLSRFPRQIGANILRADIALIEGDTKSARKVYEYLIEGFPQSPIGYFKLALLEEKEGNDVKAIELYKKVVSADRTILVPLRRLTALLAKTEGPERAFEEVAALSQNSKESVAEFNLVLGSLSMSKQNQEGLKQARAFFERAIELKPDLLPAYWGLAQLDTVSGDVDSAIKSYRALLEKDNTHIASRMLLALALEQKNSLEEAVIEYKKILESDPRFGPAANNLAWLYAERLNGDLDEALRLALLAKEELPNEGSVADTLGWVYFKRNSPRVALPLIEEAIELEQKAQSDAPVNPEMIYHLGAVQAALGEKEKAKDSLSRALKESNPQAPYYAGIEKALNELK